MGSAVRTCLLLFVLVAGTVATDQIFTTSGVPFGRNSRDPRYRVEFHPADSPFHPENGQESVPMTNHEGKHYKCFLPVEETKTMKTILPQNATNIIIESERRIKPKDPDELLEVLKDQCFYRHEGWWSYEFCYYGKIQQVHVEGEKVIQEYVLGEYDVDATDAYHENHTSESADEGDNLKDVSKRYHVHLYTNGTVCDLTDIPGRQSSKPNALQEPVISARKNAPSPFTATSCLLKPKPLAEDDSLPKEAQISIIPDPDELHNFAAYAT